MGFEGGCTGEKSMPFGENNSHVPVRLIDFENPGNNRYIITNPYAVKALQFDDEIVKVVRFPGWQDSTHGQKHVQKALRQSLLKYKLHKNDDLCDRAC